MAARRRWIASVPIIVPFLIQGFLLGGCADQTFVAGDAAADSLPLDAAVERFLWPDSIPLSDGDFNYTFPKEMYAHSKSQLFSIDPSSLTLELVGDFKPDDKDINDLAVTPQGILYALSKNDLYRVDHDTAALTWISQVGGAEGSPNVALTFEVSGTLLASDKEGVLRRIDPTTGVITEIGKYGSGLGESGDLVAIKDGTLFGVNDKGDVAKLNNELLTINPSTGAAQVVGPIGFHHVWGLAYWGGVIYGLTKQGEFLSVDPATGKGTLINTSAHEFWGAAVTPLAPID